MNGRVLWVTLVVGSTLSWISCSKGPPAVKAGPPPTAPVMLALKFPIGSRVLETINLQQTVETVVPGMPEPIKQDLTVAETYAHSVIKELSEGGHEVEVEFAGMRMSLKSGNEKPVMVDSSKAADKNEPIAVAVEKLIGCKARAFLDASNDVQRIEGVGELKSKVAAEIRKDRSGMLKDLVTEDVYRNLLRDNHGVHDKLVQPGEVWPVHEEMVMGNLGMMATDNTYTFKGWERRNEHNCARLEFSGTVGSKPGEDLRISGMAATIQPGKNSGELLFDLEEGMPVEATVNQDFGLTLAMPKQARATTAPQSITVTVSQVINIKWERVR